jgi:hypothetical protein
MSEHSGREQRLTKRRGSMADAVVDSLILDLLEWLATRDRSYDEAMEAWRTSCPKLPVWEETNDRGFVTLHELNGRRVVSVSSLGRAFLNQHKALHQHKALPR